MHFALKLIFLCYLTLMISPLKLLQLTPALSKAQIHCIQWNHWKEINPQRKANKCFAQAGSYQLRKCKLEGVCCCFCCLVQSCRRSVLQTSPKTHQGFMLVAVRTVLQAGMLVSETDIYFLALVIWRWSNFRKITAVQFVKWRDNNNRIQEGHV